MRNIKYGIVTTIHDSSIIIKLINDCYNESDIEMQKQGFDRYSMRKGETSHLFRAMEL
jgi:hypothetical protein